MALKFLKMSLLKEVKNDGDEEIVVTKSKMFHFDALLYATGRR